MKQLYFIRHLALFCFMLSCVLGCEKHIPVSPPSDDGKVDLGFNVSPAVKGLKDQIKDLNVFFFCTNINRPVHMYITDIPITEKYVLSMTVFSGENTVYAIANAGKNMSESTKLDLESWNTKDHNVLTYKGLHNINVKDDVKIDIVLKRVITKVTLNANVIDGAKKGIKDYIEVEFWNRPMFVFPFKEKSQITNEGDFLACTRYSNSLNQSNVTAIKPKAYSYTYELLIFENMWGQGSNTSEGQKSPNNSPKFATYVKLKLEDSQGFFYVYLYPGKDIINNYDIKRNDQIILNADIYDRKTIDTRIEVYNIKFTSEFPTETLLGTTVTSNFSANLNNLTFGKKVYLSYSKKNIDAPVLFLNNSKLDPNTEFLLSNQDYAITCSSTVPVLASYDVKVIVREPSIADEVLITKTLSTTFKNEPIIAEVSNLVIEPFTYQPTTFKLSLSKENYNGTFKVKYNPKGTFVDPNSIDKGRLLLRNTQIEIKPNTEVTLLQGDTWFTYYPHMTTNKNIIPHIFDLEFAITATDGETMDAMASLGEIKELNITYSSNPYEELIYSDENAPQDVEYTIEQNFFRTILLTTPYPMDVSITITEDIKYSLGHQKINYSYTSFSFDDNKEKFDVVEIDQIVRNTFTIPAFKSKASDPHKFPVFDKTICVDTESAVSGGTEEMFLAYIVKGTWIYEFTNSGSNLISSVIPPYSSLTK